MATEELLSFLHTFFTVSRYSIAEQGGIYHQSERTVHRLGLALAYSPDLPWWVSQQRFDALWLHRPWQLPGDALPPDVGVIYHHLPFDETLTMGFNQPLADTLGMLMPETLGYKQTDADAPQRAIGMIGDVTAQRFAAWQRWTTQTFGGYDQAQPGQRDEMSRVAVVGSMNDALIREAAERGAKLYLTGQYRKAAQEAVDATGMAVIAVGHRRSEEWGLMTLTHVLQRQFPALTVLHKKSGQPVG